MRVSTAFVLLLALALPVFPGSASGQAQEPLLFIFVSQEQLLVGSRSGQALLRRQEERRLELVADARSIEQTFEAEERRLTDMRNDLDPQEFRALADAFDERAVAARQEQDARSDALAQEFEQERRRFYAGIAPILVAMMERLGAKAIFDETSILLADQSLNVTDEIIAEIDAQFGDGAWSDQEAEDGAQPSGEQ